MLSLLTMSVNFTGRPAGHHIHANTRFRRDYEKYKWNENDAHSRKQTKFKNINNLLFPFNQVRTYVLAQKKFAHVFYSSVVTRMKDELFFWLKTRKADHLMKTIRLLN
jgi:hypothetical protein